METLPLNKRAQDCVHVFSFLFAKDYWSCFVLFVCKGLRPSFAAIRSQRTAVLAYLFHLQMTDVLISASVYKGSWSLSSAIYL